MIDEDIKDSINRYIAHIRRMSALNDDELRLLLTNAAETNPDLFDSLKQGATKKMIAEMRKMAKDIKTDSTKIARKVA